VETVGATSDEAQRTCAGCRKTGARDTLLRLAIVASSQHDVVPDVKGKLPGRGVWVHPRAQCIEAAAKRGAIARSLKRAVSVDTEALRLAAMLQYEQRVDGLLLGARRARKLALGTDATREAIASRGAHALVVAKDAAGRREDLERAAAQLGRSCVVFRTKAELGRLFGREELSVLAILDSGIAREAARAAAFARQLAEVA